MKTRCASLVVLLALLCAEQYSKLVVLIFDPEQIHDHGPVPATALAVPEEHKLDFGAELTVVPFAVPQYPWTVLGPRALESLSELET